MAGTWGPADANFITCVGGRPQVPAVLKGDLQCARAALTHGLDTVVRVGRTPPALAEARLHSR